MAVDKILLNLTAISNFNFTGVNVTLDPTVVLTEAPVVANTSTNYLFGWLVMFGMAFVLYIALSEERGKFRYSPLRSLGLTFGTLSIINMVLVLGGIVHNIQPTTFSLGMFILSLIAITMAEGKD